MKAARLYFIIFFGLVSVALKAQDQKQIDILDRAEKEADRLQELLGLEDWQTFYVDSTLKHDFQAMQGEIEVLQRSRVSNPDLYQGISDKWWEQIDATYKRIFTDAQWVAYMRSGGERQMKARAKRREKAEASITKKK